MSFSKKTAARRTALQALYQWLMTDAGISDIENQFKDSQDLSRVDIDYFHELISQATAQFEPLKEMLSDDVDRPFDEITPVEKAILLIGSYELVNKIEMPGRVVINESVNAAKKFGADQSHRMINGVLDRIAKRVRPNEF
ncbi:MAG: transcription antitermination factor NusB [Methylococcales bacterium]|jgi:transcription antitermination protein NusB|nr:transcription antitermination factor NusB [Methylococcales bacterium]MBT7410625.1 transcription antitermination factor NusB [Methylococcales bacterium]